MLSYFCLFTFMIKALPIKKFSTKIVSSIHWTLAFRYEPAAEDRADAADEQDAGGGVRDVPRLAPAAPPLQPQPQLLQRPGQCHCDQNVSTHYLMFLQEYSPDSHQRLLVLFSVFHLLAMSSVITNPIMYGLLNFTCQQVCSLIIQIII